LNSTRILLIESIDAVGANSRDLRVHASTLLHAGCRVRNAAIESIHAAPLHGAPEPSGDLLVVRPDARGRAKLAAWLENEADAIIVASAAEGGGEAGRWIEAASPLPAWWWPTGVTPASPAAAHAGASRSVAARTARWIAAGPLPMLPITVPSRSVCAGLDASVLDAPHARRGQLPLWDGDYVLSLTALEGAAGTAAIDAFASLCAMYEGLDFVVLADPQSEFERLARARGIGFRVHFAGEAPRDAEVAWLGAASAALVAGHAPVSGGLVLRALENGCAVIPSTGAATAAAIDAWLYAHGIAGGASDAPFAERLAQVVGGDARERTRRAAGQRLARAAGPEALARRVGDALDSALRRRRAA